MSPARRPPPPDEAPVGPYLRAARKRRGLTLRQVAEATSPKVGESYLSQIESGRIASPAPQALRALAQVYELDPLDVLRRAHYLPPEVPEDSANAPLPGWLDWLPASTLRDLDEDERVDLRNYIELILARRKMG